MEADSAGPPGRLPTAARVIALAVAVVTVPWIAMDCHGLPWIAVVVGVHFRGFAPLRKAGVFAVLAVVLTVPGVAGFVLRAVGASALTIR